MPKHRQDAAAADGGASKRRAPPSSSSSPDFSSSCPYEILGVPRNATHQIVKLSYRKLALKHHPDRQTSDLEKQTAHHNFAAIGHAYEILSDECRRREYDEELQRQQWQRQQQQSRRNQESSQDPFTEFDNIHFTDPFELFNQLFARELNDHHHRGRNNQMASDPFFNDPFFSGGGSLFSQGSGLNQMMSNSFNMMNSMSSQMNSSRSMFGGFDQQIMSSMSGGSGFGGGSYNCISTSSSSSSNRGGARHQSISTSTRTTVVNGVRQTVHERTITHPDGRVERQVTTEGGNDLGRISSSSNQHAALNYDGGSVRRSRY